MNLYLSPVTVLRIAQSSLDKCFFRISNRICLNDRNIDSCIDDDITGKFIHVAPKKKSIIAANSWRNLKRFQVRFLNF